MSISPSDVAKSWLNSFDEALQASDFERATNLFHPDGFWRDFVSFTWNLKTLEGRDAIRAMLENTLDRVQPRGWRLAETAEGDDTDCSVIIEFETAQARGKGHVRIRDGKAVTLLTTMDDLIGFEETARARREVGAAHTVARGRKSWLEIKQEECARLGYEEQPYALIVGGGQNGIVLAARLRRLGVPTIVIDKLERPGDNWRSRYKSLHLHDPVWSNHMPYMDFPDTWPVFPSKDKIGDWLEAYATIMDINYWGGTECVKADFDASTEEWSVRVRRDGEELTLQPKQLIVALGVSGYAHIPQFPGADIFTGQQHHSSKHAGGGDWQGKRAVVIGSNNSAHDIAADLWEHGGEVTIVQRTSTMVANSETLFKHSHGDMYGEDAPDLGFPVEKSDLLGAAVPLRLLAQFQREITEKIKTEDAQFYEELQKAGFELDFGEDGSGLLMKYLRRGSGYYINVGASRLIIDGQVALRHGEIAHLDEESVVLSDGTRILADVIVYATGYGSMNGWLADLISPEVADRVGKVWGYGSGTTKDPGPWEGELRNMWKPTNVENLWIHGGNFLQGRQFSKLLALQIKARMEGMDTKVYGLQPSYHKR